MGFIWQSILVSIIQLWFLLTASKVIGHKQQPIGVVGGEKKCQEAANSASQGEEDAWKQGAVEDETGCFTFGFLLSPFDS